MKKTLKETLESITPGKPKKVINEGYSKKDEDELTELIMDLNEVFSQMKKNKMVISERSFRKLTDYLENSLSANFSAIFLTIFRSG